MLRWCSASGVLAEVVDRVIVKRGAGGIELPVSKTAPKTPKTAAMISVTQKHSVITNFPMMVHAVSQQHTLSLTNNLTCKLTFKHTTQDLISRSCCRCCCCCQVSQFSLAVGSPTSAPENGWKGGKQTNPHQLACSRFSSCMRARCAPSLFHCTHNCRSPSARRPARQSLSRHPRRDPRSTTTR